MVVSTNGGSPNHAFLSRIFHQKTIQLMGYLHDFGNLVICMYQWFGLSEILQETIDVPIRELGFSCKLARKPIHWLKPLPIAYGTIDNDSCFCRLIAELKPKMARETQKPCSKRKCHFITGEERDSQNRLWYNMIVPNELGSTTPYIYKYIYILHNIQSSRNNTFEHCSHGPQNFDGCGLAPSRKGCGGKSQSCSKSPFDGLWIHRVLPMGIQRTETKVSWRFDRDRMGYIIHGICATSNMIYPVPFHSTQCFFRMAAEPNREPANRTNKNRTVIEPNGHGRNRTGKRWNRTVMEPNRQCRNRTGKRWNLTLKQNKRKRTYHACKTPSRKEK
jgi:hypothetical protein